MTTVNTSNDFDASATGVQTDQETSAPAADKGALLVEMRPLAIGMPQRMQVG